MRRLTKEELDLIYHKAGADTLRKPLQDYVNVLGMHASMLALKMDLTSQEATEGMAVAMRIWKLTDLRTLQINELGGK